MSGARSVRCIALAALLVAGCRAAPAVPDEAARLATLQAAYERLHERLEAAAAREPLVEKAFADKGTIAIAIRSRVIESMAGRLAHEYLDQVVVDLASVDAHKEGKIKKSTLFGKLKIGDWRIGLEIGALAGTLTAGVPRIRLQAPDLIGLELPVEVKAATGRVTVKLAWDSAALVNVVCKDFELTREIVGRVPPQRHAVSGAFQLTNTGAALTATPLFPDRTVRLKLELPPESWSVVEEALKSQNTAGRCGILLHPEKGVEQLRELGATGIDVKLPDKIFETLELPTHFEETVTVAGRPLSLKLKAESLRVTPELLWTSASLEVQAPAADPSPGP